MDAQGQVIAAPTLADILAQAHAAGTAWTTEEIGFNPYADIPVEKIGIYFLDGKAIDYTVEVTDERGTFYVWARNLDYAMELQQLQGNARGYSLRNFEVEFFGLDEVGSSDNSKVRVELLTPEQFHFATQLFGVAFRPQMLSATYVDATGQLSYSINDTGLYRADSLDGTVKSDIKTMLNLLDNVMDTYVTASRAFAARIALQGGLKDFMQGIKYDVVSDKYVPTAGREMVPMFEEIFRHAPEGYEPTRDYLMDWAEILWQVYPDYIPDGSKNQFGMRLAVDQPYIVQMALAAFENVPVDADVLAILDALGVNEERLKDGAGDGALVTGTSKQDYFYLNGGENIQSGGFGTDFYYAGRNFGQQTIRDYDKEAADDLRFLQLTSDKVDLTRDGMDLLVTEKGTTNVIRLQDQFLGELAGFYLDGKPIETGVNSITFADGMVFDRFRMAFEVADPTDENQVYTGTGSADVLWGGKGNDALHGGVGGDIYIFARGDGQDVMGEGGGGISFGAVQAAIDFLQFRGDITADDLYMTRAGQSDDLLIQIKDKQGNITTDQILLQGQFAGLPINLGGFSDILGGSAGLDYASPNMIEKFIFEDGTSLGFSEIGQKVIDNAKTDGEDVIYGLLNGNTIAGGKGNDLLIGVQGPDTYVFGRGDGHDVIRDDNYAVFWFAPDIPDILRFKDDIRWTDIEFLRNGRDDDLTLKVRGTDDAVTIEDFMEYLTLFFCYPFRIETLEFGGGVKWDWLKLLQHYVAIAKTAGDDEVYGFNVIGDVLDGGAGNDLLQGLQGNDRYIFARGYGEDTVWDVYRTSNPLTETPPGTDRVVLQNINFFDVDITRTALDLIFTVRDSGDRLILKNQYVRDSGQYVAVEYIEFADRTIAFTDLNPEDVDVVGGAGDETLTGSDFAEIIDGKDGNDILIGNSGGDTYKFDVGYGDDIIIDDAKRSNWSDRKGVVVPVDDKVLFGADISLDNVSFVHVGNDLVVYITTPGRTDSLRIKDQFLSPKYGIELFVFENGDTITIAEAEQLAGIVNANRGDNTITGSTTLENAFDGLQGDDTYHGGNAADTYAFGIGYDLDTIHEVTNNSLAIDKVVFGEGVTSDDLILRRFGNDLVIDLGDGVDVLRIVNGLTTARIEEFHFTSDGTIVALDTLLGKLLVGTDGDEQIVGFINRNDVIDSGAGSDAMVGETGNDTYKWGYGDGLDSISDTGGIDEIVFKNLNPDDVAFRKVDGDLLIVVRETNERLVVFGGNVVEKFTFSDGTVQTIAEVLKDIRDSSSNGSHDKIVASTLLADEVVLAGAGFDVITLDANRTMVFAQGDGIDTVTAPANARIEFDRLSSVDATFRRASAVSDDLIVSFAATGDQLILKGALSATAIAVLAFADGVDFNLQNVLEKIVAQEATDGADIIRGTQGADSIEGGGGDDEIIGLGGNDNYIFRRGDGRDVYFDDGGIDILTIHGYVPNDMTISRPVADRDEIILTFAGSDDEITLHFENEDNGINFIRFSNGAEISREMLFAKTVGKGTVFDDEIFGSNGADTLQGGRGNDKLYGGWDADTYIFRRGDGSDLIDEAYQGSTLNRLLLPDHTPEDISLVQLNTEWRYTRTSWKWR